MVSRSELIFNPEFNHRKYVTVYSGVSLVWLQRNSMKFLCLEVIGLHLMSTSAISDNIRSDATVFAVIEVIH